MNALLMKAAVAMATARAHDTVGRFGAERPIDTGRTTPPAGPLGPPRNTRARPALQFRWQTAPGAFASCANSQPGATTDPASVRVLAAAPAFVF